MSAYNEQRKEGENGSVRVNSVSSDILEENSPGNCKRRLRRTLASFNRTQTFAFHLEYKGLSRLRLPIKNHMLSLEQRKETPTAKHAGGGRLLLGAP